MDILFITATRIGDAVLTTGLLGYLIERHPGARVTIAAGPVAAPLFEAVPGLERIIAVKKQALAAHWLGLYATVARRRWDIAVDLRGSALTWLLRTGKRYVAAKGDQNEHRVRHLARLFDLDPAPSPRLWLSSNHENAADAVIPPGSPVLAIGPAANWRGKQWRAERFAELAQRLTARDGPLPGARVAVIAAAHERPQAEPALAAIPSHRVIDLVGRLDLLTTAAVLQRSALFIGNDTGLMHIAAASGVPTLGLFGPSPIEQYAPWGACTATVRTEAAPETMFGPGFDHRTTDTLMDTLSLEAAEAGARALWSRATSKAA